MNRAIRRYDRGKLMEKLDLCQGAMMVTALLSRRGEWMGMDNGGALLDVDMREKSHAAVVGYEQQRQEHSQVFSHSITQDDPIFLNFGCEDSDI